MKSIQEIFNTVINNGTYTERGYMCPALSASNSLGLITKFECEYARYLIRIYMYELNTKSNTNHITISRCLEKNGFCNNDLVSFYRNWGNRPKVKIGILRNLIKYIAAL